MACHHYKIADYLVEKRRRGLEEESGVYTYVYDSIGRLHEGSKDGELISRYSYDAFGNRIQKKTGGETTTYTYNTLNQLVKKDRPGRRRGLYL